MMERNAIRKLGSAAASSRRRCVMLCSTLMGLCAVSFHCVRSSALNRLRASACQLHHMLKASSPRRASSGGSGGSRTPGVSSIGPFYEQGFRTDSNPKRGLDFPSASCNTLKMLPDEYEELLDSKVTFHDRNRFEVKLDVNCPAARP